jgi:NAD(P)-dependent dehydrogenase (short-subunit alcohol dehydrogenase family)
MAAPLRLPFIDRRQAALIEQVLELVDAQSLKLDREAGFRHSAVLDCFAARLKAGVRRMTERTAIVTGAGKRVGEQIARSLIEDGWAVVAHVHRGGDDVPRGAKKAVADLADLNCADPIFKAAQGLPPVRLLVNNASRFEWDGFGEFNPAELDAHMAVNVRSPALLIERFAAEQDGREDALVVNILDSKLAALDADFLSYTLSKQALYGLTELAARALAPRGIRVNGVAPGLMLRSSGQSVENFEAMHANNPLRRGVTADDVVGALRYLISAPCVTGQVLVVDAGQRFMALGRDVQFLEAE